APRSGSQLRKASVDNSCRRLVARLPAAAPSWLAPQRRGRRLRGGWALVRVAVRLADGAHFNFRVDVSAPCRDGQPVQIEQLGVLDRVFKYANGRLRRHALRLSQQRPE